MGDARASMKGDQWARSRSQVPVDGIPGLTWLPRVRDGEIDLAAGGSWRGHDCGWVLMKAGPASERMTAPQ